MYQFFKGYVPTRNKKCSMTFKGKSADELLTLEEAEKLSEYAGILADNTILIDIDEPKQAEILARICEDKQLHCRIYQTTRGKHFLFKNDDRASKCWTKGTLACGLMSDGKLGCRNSYSVLKFDKKTRHIEFDINNDQDYETVPKWLLPVHFKIDFLDMSEGDGRNQELFNYILRLQSAGYSKDEIRECIQIINEYVLKKPLSAKELNTILRDEAFQKPVFYDGKTFLHDKFGLYLISEYNIIKIAGVLHYFKDGVYVPANLEGLMIKHIQNLKQQQRKEVLAFMNAYIDHNTPCSPANCIAFQNGIYDVTTGVLTPFDKGTIITNLIRWNYNPTAYSELADKVLNDLACGDKRVRMLLEELIGYTFYRRNELRKAFMLKGKRHNGKSTFLDMLAHLLGEDNVSALDLSELSHEFKAAGLFGKLANIGDDIEDEFIPSAGIFKKIVSGDRINANVKMQAPIEFNPYCKLIFSGNTIPRLGRGRDCDAIIDRLIIVPFNGSFDKSSPNFSPYIKYDLRSQECMEYLVKIGIEGLQRVLQNNSFTTTEEIEQELVEYEESLNPIQSFFDEMGEKIMNNPVNKNYRLYCQFCFETNMKPISQIEFSKQVKEAYKCDIKVKRIDGEPTRVFVKKEGD